MRLASADNDHVSDGLSPLVHRQTISVYVLHRFGRET